MLTNTGGIFLNIMVFADDLVLLLAPSWHALQDF